MPRDYRSLQALKYLQKKIQINKNTVLKLKTMVKKDTCQVLDISYILISLGILRNYQRANLQVLGPHREMKVGLYVKPKICA